MREMGFITMLPDVLGVFVDLNHVGTIRKHEGSYQFILSKSRKPMDADTLRAIANKIEIMNGPNHV